MVKLQQISPPTSLVLFNAQDGLMARRRRRPRIRHTMRRTRSKVDLIAILEQALELIDPREVDDHGDNQDADEP